MRSGLEIESVEGICVREKKKNIARRSGKGSERGVLTA